MTTQPRPPSLPRTGDLSDTAGYRRKNKPSGSHEFATLPDAVALVEPLEPGNIRPRKRSHRRRARSLLRFARQALPVEKISWPWHAVQQYCGWYAWRGELREPCAVSRIACRLCSGESPWLPPAWQHGSSAAPWKASCQRCPPPSQRRGITADAADGPPCCGGDRC